jgi:type I restriction enzyme S subunit
MKMSRCVVQNQPEVRFGGFADAWEQRALGELGATFTGLSGKTKEDFGHGDAEFVTYMNVFSNPIAASNSTENVEIDGRQSSAQYGDVFFTTSSETPEEVGMSSIWLENRANVYLNSFCFGYRPAVKFDPYYLAFMLRSSTIRKKLTFLAQGISRYNISKNKVMEMTVPVPQLDEQECVGAFFSTLDRLLTLHQRKLKRLQNFSPSFCQPKYIRRRCIYINDAFKRDWGLTAPRKQRTART